MPLPESVQAFNDKLNNESVGRELLSADTMVTTKANQHLGNLDRDPMQSMASGSSQDDVRDDKPYTAEELERIITADTGGYTLLPSEAYDEVYPSLYIGEESIAKSRTGLKKLGITHILNAAKGKDDGYHVHTNHVMYSRVGITYLGIEATDMSSFNLAKSFDKCADFIDQALENGGKVMVNCKQGASRSATIVLTFLMIKRHMTVAEATRLVRSKREICPNDGFLQQLCDLNEKLKAKGHFEQKKNSLEDNTDQDVT